MTRARQFVRLCECGCGEPTFISPRTTTAGGRFRGQPLRYLPAHGGRTAPCRPLADRFWEKVEKGAPTECWPWRAHTRNGYGRIVLNGRHIRATEAALRLAGVDVSPGMLICHRCDNPICVNPSHLFVGTHRDNSDDKIAKGRYRQRPLHGEEHHQARLTDAQALEIRRRHNNRKGVRAALALEFGVKPETITDIANGRTWRHLPLKESA